MVNIFASASAATQGQSCAGILCQDTKHYTIIACIHWCLCEKAADNGQEALQHRVADLGSCCKQWKVPGLSNYHLCAFDLVASSCMYNHTLTQITH